MWVLGDLKDRLGIKHRRDRKRIQAEHAPMFHQPHYRSESEISQHDEEYAPQTLYTPPMPRTPASDGSPRPTAPLIAGQSPRPEKQEIQRIVEHGASPVPSPTPSNRDQLNPSPSLQRLSYYSVSNIPAPSPMPESNRYHEYTRDSTARSTTAYAASPPMSAVSHSSVTYNQPPASPTHLSLPPSASLQVPGMRQQQQQRAQSPAEQYEMRVRSPNEQWAAYPEPGSARAIHTPMATEDSYMTARDDYDGFDAAYAPPSAAPHHEQEESWRSSTYSYSGPHAL